MTKATTINSESVLQSTPASASTERSESTRARTGSNTGNDTIPPIIKDLMQTKQATILELGTGTGLVSIVLATLLSHYRLDAEERSESTQTRNQINLDIIATDLPSAMEILESNLSDNSDNSDNGFGRYFPSSNLGLGGSGDSSGSGGPCESESESSIRAKAVVLDWDDYSDDNECDGDGYDEHEGHEGHEGKRDNHDNHVEGGHDANHVDKKDGNVQNEKNVERNVNKTKEFPVEIRSGVDFIMYVFFLFFLFFNPSLLPYFIFFQKKNITILFLFLFLSLFLCNFYFTLSFRYGRTILITLSCKPPNLGLGKIDYALLHQLPPTHNLLHRSVLGGKIRMADVTYNTASFPSLIQLLHLLSRPSHLSSLTDSSLCPTTAKNTPKTPKTPRTPTVLLAYKERDPDERRLWDMARDIGLRFDQIDCVPGAGAGGMPVEIYVGTFVRSE